MDLFVWLIFPFVVFIFSFASIFLLFFCMHYYLVIVSIVILWCENMHILCYCKKSELNKRETKLKTVETLCYVFTAIITKPRCTRILNICKLFMIKKSKYHLSFSMRSTKTKQCHTNQFIAILLYANYPTIWLHFRWNLKWRPTTTKRRQSKRVNVPLKMPLNPFHGWFRTDTYTHSKLHLIIKWKRVNPLTQWHSYTGKEIWLKVFGPVCMLQRVCAC